MSCKAMDAAMAFIKSECDPRTLGDCMKECLNPFNWAGSKKAKMVTRGKTPIPNFKIGENVKHMVPPLTKEQIKGIKSLEKQIAAHEKKLEEFRRNPTIRPGVENLPVDVIAKQQQRRIDHLQKEINTFKNNIDKIKNDR